MLIPLIQFNKKIKTLIELRISSTCAPKIVYSIFLQSNVFPSITVEFFDTEVIFDSSPRVNMLLFLSV